MPQPVYVEQILDRPRPDDEVVLSDATRSLTAAGLRREVWSLARVIEALDLPRGTVVALVTGNVCAALTVRYAAQLAGHVTAHVPDGRNPGRTAAFLREIGADVVVATAGKAAVVAAAGSGLRVISVEDELLAPARTVDDAPFAAVPVPDDAAAYATSGGTTGAPKASLRSHAEWLGMVLGREDPLRRQLVCTPIAYVAQVHADQTLLGGGRVVLREPTIPFDAAGALAAIDEERITHVGLVEPALVRLLDHPDLHRRDLASLLGVAHIGSDASPALRTRLLGRLRDAGIGDVLVHPYGASEVGVVSVLAGPDYSLDAADLLATAGRPLPGVDVRILGPDGAETGPGAEGEIAVRTPGQCATTTRETAPAERSHRRTGDHGFLDPDGRLTVRGRLVDAVDGPDGRVFPVDVQHALCSLPEVAYAVALPRPTRDGFDAAVVLLPGAALTPDELRDRVRGSLPLGRVVVLDDMPVTEQGKPDRRALAARLAS